jgi:hypothetical protein
MCYQPSGKEGFVPEGNTKGQSQKKVPWALVTTYCLIPADTASVACALFIETALAVHRPPVKWYLPSSIHLRDGSGMEK